MEQISTRVAEYSVTAAALAKLRTDFAGATYDVTTKDGMKAARAARHQLRSLRTALEEKRVEIKAPVLQQARLIDDEARRITREIAALEDPIAAQISAQERIEEEKRQAAIRAEQERLAAEERARREAEERRIAEENAKIEAARAELARQQAELRAAEEKARQERAEADRQARAKIEAEERAARERIEEQERQARIARQAEEDRIRAARQKLEDEQRTKEAAERRQREEVEAREREARLAEENRLAQERRERERLEFERMDSRRMLEKFCETYAHLHPELVATIREYLARQVPLAA